MLQNFWKKKNSQNSPSDDKEVVKGGKLTWTKEAQQALEQSVSKAPVPKLLKNRMKKELQKAAEEVTRKAGQTEVTAEDLMHGLLAKLPPGMKHQIQQAAKQGPAGLKALEKKFRKK